MRYVFGLASPDKQHHKQQKSCVTQQGREPRWQQGVLSVGAGVLSYNASARQIKTKKVQITAGSHGAAQIAAAQGDALKSRVMSNLMSATATAIN
jgi:hypothetical protein